MTTPGLSFVTVVFEAENLLLRLQARSMRLFLADDLVDEIVVIDNSARGMSARIEEDLLAEYGGLAPKVRIRGRRDICRVPGTIGWRAQQVLKLSVARHLSTERYVVLDAKNHFVDAVQPDLFVAVDGRAKVTAHSYEQHVFRPQLEYVLRYLGLDPAGHVAYFTGTIPPFVFHTALVDSMISDIERRSGKPFPEEFVANDLMEFLLYTGWLLASGRSIEDVFEVHRAPWPTVWPGSANRGGLDEALREARERRSPGFAVHRKALARLDADSRRALAGFWTSRGLFASDEEAEHFVADFARAFRRARLPKRARELPHRARAMPRRLIGKLRVSVR